MNLDQESLYKKLDTDQVGESIALLPIQLQQIFKEKKIQLPKNYKNFSNVVISGMGGSNLGAHIIQALFRDSLKIPLIISPNYTIPSFVNKNTLFIASSYSGSTEEIITSVKIAEKKKAKILILAENNKNKLQNLALKNNWAHFFFDVLHNPCGQPRLATGYSIASLIKILKDVNALQINNSELQEALIWIENVNQKNNLNKKSSGNQAKKIALKLENKIPILIGAEFMLGNLHTLRNQLNETAKLFCDYLEIPDLNHHAMEGLTNPKSNSDNLCFVFFESELYSKKIQDRIKLTEQVVKKNKISTLKYKLKGKNKIAQSFELLQLGSWLSYYLAITYNINPVKVPYVDWFKEQLSQNS